MTGDLLTTEDAAPSADGLLQVVMRNGRRLVALPSLQDARRLAQAELERLPAALRALSAAPDYAVAVDEPLCALAREVDSRTTMD